MIDEEILSKAAEEANHILLQSLPENQECNHKFSSDFEKKMEQLNRKSKHPKTYRFLKRVAGFLLILFIGAASFLTINTEARPKAFGLIKKQYETYTSYLFKTDKTDAAANQNFTLGALPDDYTETVRRDLSDSHTIIYDNEADDRITFAYSNGSGNRLQHISHKNSVRSTVKIHKFDADLYISSNPEGDNAIIWVDINRNTIFYLAGRLDADKLIEIAESIEDVTQ